MQGIRYSTEEKIRILREVEGSGQTIEDVCRAHQISEQTSHQQEYYCSSKPYQQFVAIQQYRRKVEFCWRVIAN
ncbi:MAG: transposase [Verrucomicrobiae bacterium]|nr:transposase [Verrucomicrobiae bacterium]